MYIYYHDISLLLLSNLGASCASLSMTERSIKDVHPVDAAVCELLFLVSSFAKFVAEDHVLLLSGPLEHLFAIKVIMINVQFNIQFRIYYKIFKFRETR